MYTCTSFLNRNWIILYILLNNLLFKMCIYIVEYVIHTQVQSSGSTKSSSLRTKSPSHPVCQPLVLQPLLSPCRGSYAFSKFCIYFVTTASRLDTFRTLWYFIHNITNIICFVHLPSVFSSILIGWVDLHLVTNLVIVIISSVPNLYCK